MKLQGQLIANERKIGMVFYPFLSPCYCLWVFSCGSLLTLKLPQLGWSEVIVAMREMFLH